jgi:hypothetical protein
MEPGREVIETVSTLFHLAAQQLTRVSIPLYGSCNYCRPSELDDPLLVTGIAPLRYKEQSQPNPIGLMITNWYQIRRYFMPLHYIIITRTHMPMPLDDTFSHSQVYVVPNGFVNITYLITTNKTVTSKRALRCACYFQLPSLCAKMSRILD